MHLYRVQTQQALRIQIIDVLSKVSTLGGYRLIPMMPSKTFKFLFLQEGVYQSLKSFSLSHTHTNPRAHMQTHTNERAQKSQLITLLSF